MEKSFVELDNFFFFRLHATNEKILLKEIEKKFVELDERE